MTKAFEVMTRSLASCAPDEPVTSVAATMRERDIGSVVVLKDGALQGIVTDRDLAVRALTSKDELSAAPVHKYMSSPVITGEAGWSLERVSETMAKHQIRRLPIVEEGQLTGIVSLGDVARHADKKQTVAKSLRAISAPSPAPVLARLGDRRVLGLFALAASAGTVIAMLSSNDRLPGRRKKSAGEALYAASRNLLGAARQRLNGAVSAGNGNSLRSFGMQLRTKVGDLTTQLAPARK